MVHDKMMMPMAVRKEIEYQLEVIQCAATSSEVEKAAARAQGFVLGIERLRALRDVDIESLYVLFENEAALRIDELRSSRSI